MRVLRFDSVGGASGDMILGALIDLGVDAERLQAALSSLPIGAFEIEARAHESHHLRGTLVTVHANDPLGVEVHRHLKEVLDIIAAADLPDSVREQSARVFQRLAEAEGGVHGIPPEEVHFHEVGAVDAVVDIVGACMALEWLEVDAVTVGPLPLGCGTTECAHGTIPVPVPATVELLKGLPTTQTTEPHELVTPTGAALLAEWTNVERPPAGSRIDRVGHGFGQRLLDGRPNLLRAYLLEAPSDNAVVESCLVIECNLDDTVPELMGTLAERLMREGALDAFTAAVQMKKQRPGTLLTVLCRPETRDALMDIIFRESTTFGVREYLTTRTVLARRHEAVETPYGTVRIKIGTWCGQDVTFAPEMDDCVRRAEEHGVAVRLVYEAAVQASNGIRP